MLHPAAAHFAVVLPILSLVLGIAYLIKPSELMSKISTRFMVAATIFMIIAYFLGKNDGTEAYMLLSSDAKALLLEHKTFGLYLTWAMGITTLIKMFGCFKNNFKAEIVAVALMALIVGATLFQGKMGGELTYNHGANVTKHAAGMECLADEEEDDEDEE